jgi:hypothetical protein
MQYCEVYCTAACCGTDAFEVHPALILRKTIDDNLGGRDGQRLFRRAWQQLQTVISLVATTELINLHNELPFWSEEETELPQYWLPKAKVLDWLQLWNEAFEKASHTGGLNKEKI